MDLLSLQTGDLVTLIVSGYLGFKISQLGDQKKHSAEDILIQSLIFGAIGSSLAKSLISEYSNSAVSSANWVLASSILMSVLIGVIWRRVGAPTVASAMKSTGVYRGDSHSTALRSISNVRATWHYVAIHKKDGTVLMSNIDATQPGIPLRGITTNDDGVCLYVTSINRVDGTTEAFQVTEDGLSTLTYVPLAEIQQIDVTWK